MSGAGDEISAAWQGNYGDDLERLRGKMSDVRPHMSPAQAAQAANVSRWTIMRAIKSHALQASRDNRNQWRIAPNDLAAWQSHTVRDSPEPHTMHTTEDVIRLTTSKTTR